MNNKEAIRVLKSTSINFSRMGGKTAYVEALEMAITALQMQDKLQDIEYMCRLSGGADYFRVFAALSEKTNNSNEQLNNSTATQSNGIENRVKGMTACRVPEDKETIDDNTVCVVFCNWTVAKELVDKDENIEDCLVVSSYLDDDEAVVVSKDEFLKWLRGEQDGDCISRQVTIEAMESWYHSNADISIKDVINGLPSAQPVAKDIDVLNTDCISRQSAIDAIIAKLDAIDHVPQWVFDELTGVIADLPSAQTEITNEEIRIALKQLKTYILIKIRDKKDGDVPVELLQRIEEIQEYVGNLPSAQTEIIRCRDCKYAINIGTPDMMCKNSKAWVVATDNNFGCVFSERRTDGQIDE